MLPLDVAENSLDNDDGNSSFLSRKFESINCKMVDNFLDLVHQMPAPGELLALFSLKQFNAFSIVMAMLQTYGHIDYCAVSSYNISRKIITAFAELATENKIALTELFISDVAKSMFPKSFDLLNEYTATIPNLKVSYCWNHSKVAIISAGGNFFVCEGSGNFSYNARHEQYVLINDQKFYEFRKTNLVSMAAINGQA